MNRLSVFISAFLVCFLSWNYGEASKLFSLGTASTKGTYFPVGRAFCEQINRFGDEHKLRCLEYVTGGSVYNIHALMTGELDLAITRSDLAYFAYNGKNRFKGLANHGRLRTVLNLYTQPLLISVKKDSGIKSFDHFAGRSINIGNKGSGKRDIAEKIFRIMNWRNSHFSGITEYSTTQQDRPFCGGEVDILVEAIGLPNTLYSKLVEKCDAIFIGIPPKVARGLRNVGPFFFDTTIPRFLNPSYNKPVQTVGMKVVLLTTSSKSSRSIEILARTILNNLKDFRDAHPALSGLTKKSLFFEGIRVPLHAGVQKALKVMKD